MIQTIPMMKVVTLTWMKEMKKAAGDLSLKTKMLLIKMTMTLPGKSDVRQLKLLKQSLPHDQNK